MLTSKYIDLGTPSSTTNHEPGEARPRGQRGRLAVYMCRPRQRAAWPMFTPGNYMMILALAECLWAAARYSNK